MFDKHNSSEVKYSFSNMWKSYPSKYERFFKRKYKADYERDDLDDLPSQVPVTTSRNHSCPKLYYIFKKWIAS